MPLTTLQSDRALSLITQNVSTSGTSLTIDVSLGGYIILTLTGASVTSVTFTNWPSGCMGKIIIEVRNQGAFNITGWGVKWAGGTAPTITSGAGKYDLLAISTGDGGTTKYGNIIGQNYS